MAEISVFLNLKSMLNQVQSGYKNISFPNGWDYAFYLPRIDKN
jgi:hypothetical protein